MQSLFFLSDELLPPLAFSDSPVLHASSAFDPIFAEHISDAHLAVQFVVIDRILTVCQAYWSLCPCAYGQWCSAAGAVWKDILNFADCELELLLYCAW